MTVQHDPFTLNFPEWYEARAEYETPLKGFLGDVGVRLDDGPPLQAFLHGPGLVTTNIGGRLEAWARILHGARACRSSEGYCGIDPQGGRWTLAGRLFFAPQTGRLTAPPAD
jgi:hypothetical protein